MSTEDIEGCEELEEIEESIAESEEKQPPKIIFAESDVSGYIDLSFYENLKYAENKDICYPITYYTLSAKERLILLTAENFRQQFSIKYPNRRPLVLAPKNELDVQKFVSTTIRPTPLLFPKLIGSLEEISKFVANFVTYEQLDDLLMMPKRLASPDHVLKQRKGNSYEMATLLCSLLIGAGYSAMVVSGSASEETTLCDQRHFKCPYLPNEDNEEENIAQRNAYKPEKYLIVPPPQFRIGMVLKLDSDIRPGSEEGSQIFSENEDQLQLIRQKNDPYLKRRYHAWVVVIRNAQWSRRPIEENPETGFIDIDAEFIEPSTGLKYSTKSPQYTLIDSIWNNENYYVNLQDTSENGLGDMKWDLSKRNDWEYFLPNEPVELRVLPSTEDVVLNIIEEEKHLDLFPSWVQKLYISYNEYDQLYPGKEKSIYYKKCLYQRFSPYSFPNGLTKKFILYQDSEYEEPEIEYEIFENREDCLYQIKTNFSTNQVEESYHRSRMDSLLKYCHHVKDPQPFQMIFNCTTRFDSLRKIEFYGNSMIMHFDKRDDFLFYREFVMKNVDLFMLTGKDLIRITDKYHRNEAKHCDEDIHIRKLLLSQGKISLQFHYANDGITASTRDFTKPSKTDVSIDPTFDPELTTGYCANPFAMAPTHFDIYNLITEHLNEEKLLIKKFEKVCEEIETILTQRKDDMANPHLKFSIFDPLRNKAAKKIILKEYNEKIKEENETATKTIDYLEKYLVPYGKRNLDFRESWDVFNRCLHDLKSRYINILNGLQKQYDELSKEGRSMRDFLTKYQAQFDDYDYDHLLEKEASIEQNKRIIQMRLNQTRDEAEKKYETIKKSIEKDARLNLKRRK